MPGQTWWRSALSAAIESRRGGQARASTICASISEARSGTSSANSRNAGRRSVSSESRAPRSGSKSCFSARLLTSSGENDTSRTLCFSARVEQELEAALLAARQPREVGEKQDPAGRLGKKLGRRLGEELRAGQEGRARRGEEPREQLRPHASLAAQQERRGHLRELRQALFRIRERRRAAERRERELRRRGRLGAA